MQIIAHPFGGNVLGRKAGFFIDQLVFDGFLRLQTQGLPFGACAGLNFVGGNEFCCVIDVDLDVHDLALLAWERYLQKAMRFKKP